MRESAHPMGLRFSAALILVRSHPDVWLHESFRLFYQLMESDTETLESISHYVGVSSMFYGVIDALDGYPDMVLRWVIAQAGHKDAVVRQQVGYSLQRLIAKGVVFAEVVPTIRLLLDDPVPDVRQSALVVVYNSPHARELIDEIRGLAENDPSLTVRTVARNVLSFI